MCVYIYIYIYVYVYACMHNMYIYIEFWHDLPRSLPFRPSPLSSPPRAPEVSWVVLAPGLPWTPANCMLRPSDESQTKLQRGTACDAPHTIAPHRLASPRISSHRMLSYCAALHAMNTNSDNL